jgi:D-alanyl-D-alanine carboxypeptidase/D-alanyl-D-alanine-endopeptidase (penicillin-binding protein 4)
MENTFLDRNISRPRNALLPFGLVLLLFVWHLGPQAAAQTVRPRVSPTVTPASTASASPTPSQPVNVQTIDNLQTRLRQRVAAPEAARGRVGVKIVSLTSGKVIFENDADKYFVPASNMKNFTVAAAIEKLTPDFRFVTSVYAQAKPDPDGAVKGDLWVLGRGDVSISTAFNNGDYCKGLDNLVDKIAAAGVKRIEGSLVAADTYFHGYAVPQTWEWNDLQWYYGAEVSAFPINDNAVDLKVTAGTAGGPCAVTISPQTTLFQITNLCTTRPAGSARTLQVFKSPGRNVLELSGAMPAGDKFEGYLSISRPAELFVELLKQRLALRGITVSGSARVAPSNIDLPADRIEVARLESLPLSAIAARTMKVSQNMYTETLLWTLGEETGRKAGMSGDSAAAGISVVNGFLASAGLPPKSVLQYDGSGLSRHNLVTPSAIAALYRYMATQSKYSAVWRSSLSIGGVDGTLNKRFAGSAVAGNLQGKTGTLDQVSALSGYLTTAGGDQLVISVIVNGVQEANVRKDIIDKLVTDVAAFTGKAD